MMHRKPLLRIAFTCLSFAVTGLCAHAQWTPPTPEELSMTAQPEAPGGPAVYLFREEVTNDENHNESVYVRIKVLTERGKKYGTVELPYNAGSDAHVNVTDIEGRTIHPDGTIVPFTGKPYQKLVEKGAGVKVMSKVFSLPDVEVGSIVEYRFHRRYDDNYYIAPTWLVQTELYTRKAHFGWLPTSKQLVTDDERGTLSNRVAYLPLLPTGTDVKVIQSQRIGNQSGSNIMDLTVANLLPVSEEEFIPPFDALGYRVLFYYTPYTRQEEYWREEGKHWSKISDKFIGPGPGVSAAVGQLTTPSDKPLEKLHKLYHAIMELENTDFTRTHMSGEGHPIKNTDDVLAQKVGSGDQLTELFVAMARAAGFKASLASITNRDDHFFLKGYLSFRQLDDYVAIVDVDGQDLFFDPGQRYMAFQHMAWRHSLAGGIRQSDKGVVFVQTPGETFKNAIVQRTGDLHLDKDGIATGTVKLTFIGLQAAQWRERWLEGDDKSLNDDLIESCRTLLGKDMDVKVEGIDRLQEFEDPLVVNFTITGQLGSRAGSRLILPADPFVAATRATFAAKDRKFPVYFHFTHIDQDGVLIHLPAGYVVESLPKANKLQYKKVALYNYAAEQSETSFTVHRDFVLATILFSKEDYPDLRTFFNTFEAADHESVVLKPVPSQPGN